MGKFERCKSDYFIQIYICENQFNFQPLAKQTHADMSSIYLKKEFKDGTIYYRIDPIAQPDDDYIYEAVEIAVEEDTISRDEFELTKEDLEEMYEDGFQKIVQAEFDKIETEHHSLDL